MQRDDSLLLDMLQAARQILEYTNGLQEPDFLAAGGTRTPCCFSLQYLVRRLSVYLSNSKTLILRSLGEKS